MAASQRNKGAAGERELCSFLSRALHRPITRNLSQTRDGGDDILDVGPFDIEVRRREQLSLGSWWADVCARPIELNRFPALAYRQSRQPWRIMVPLRYFRPQIGSNEPVTLTLNGFVQVVKAGRV